ncbi:SDR family oxidoreductase [Pseudomonas lopnurensis]|uniref:SDR family oxidoreductase n=2 Tax=Pseudomonas lopnurensis TaxID=1477517 RepID=UPI00187AA2F0|nr:SDR family oxidoreductase [Pseudomonas lopnurensis]MBE7375173.1 SDR family oxidoreductase [Pseudomonas lopnurensis]
MRILLVGGGGFIGRHLLRSLAADGHDLIATSRAGSGQPLPSVRWLVLDLERLALDPGSFAWPAGVDLLINAAGLLDSDAERLARTQDLGARRLFDLAAAGGARILQFSALGAGAQPDVPFLASKAAADAYLLGLGVPAVVLRPSLVLGGGGASSAWFARLSPWPLIPLLDTRARVQPLHVDDLVAAVLALLRHWPSAPIVLPLVGPQPMTVPQLLDQLRAAQGWRPARYLALPGMLARPLARIGEGLGWRALNRQTLGLAGRDNLASPEPLAMACGYRAAPLQSRLGDWPRRAESVAATLRPLMLAVLALLWLGTAAVCLGPGYEWGLRIMAELGIRGTPAAVAVVAGALLDALLGIGLLWRRWRRPALRAQLGLMLGYMAIISLWLPHYWFDPFAAVGKNLVLLVATLWLLLSEPSPREGER